MRLQRLISSLALACALGLLAPAARAEPGFEPSSSPRSVVPGVPWDALVAGGARVAIGDEKAREAVKKEHGVALKEGMIAFRGRFTPGYSPAPELAVVDLAKRSLTLYRGSEVTHRARKLPLADEKRARALGLPSAILPVSLVQDGTLQLMIVREIKSKKGAKTWRVSVLKPMGVFFGRVFDRAVATQLPKESEPTLTAQIGFYEGKKHRVIAVEPVGDGETEWLRWNKWEGSFRVPYYPPTAPKRSGES